MKRVPKKSRKSTYQPPPDKLPMASYLTKGRRTAATWEALERDSWICQRCVHKEVVAPATDGHHMFGRHVDVPEAIIGLCHGCHMALHAEGYLDAELLEIQIQRGVLTVDKAEQLAQRQFIPDRLS